MSTWRQVAALRPQIRGGDVVSVELPAFHTIQAVPREIFGHRIAARERAQGRIPVVVFSQSYVQKNPRDPTSITASTSVSQILLLTAERKQIKAVLKDVEMSFFCSTTFPLQTPKLENPNSSSSSSLILN